MRTFKTLLLREWLQYWRGWVLVCVGPALLLFVMFGFLGLSLGGFVESPDDPRSAAIQQMRAVTWFFLSSSWVTAFFTVCLQAPGLARRDHRDRSFEFWLSMPASQAQTVSAMLCAHFLFVPLAALVCGLVVSWVSGPAVVARTMGSAALQGLSLASGLPDLLQAAARQVFASVFAVLWASPFVLAVMAATAWLKRWGLPMVAGFTWMVPEVMKNQFGMTLLSDSIGTISRHVFVDPFLQAVGRVEVTVQNSQGVEISRTQQDMAAFVNAQTLAEHASDLASPLFLAVVLTSIFFAWLLVLHRERGS